MTPNEIEVLIHCHVSPTDHPRKDAPAVRDALQNFLHCELVENVDGIYYTTSRGRAHIAQLCNIEFPAQAWVTKHGEIISA